MKKYFTVTVTLLRTKRLLFKVKKESNEYAETITTINILKRAYLPRVQTDYRALSVTQK